MSEAKIAKSFLHVDLDAFFASVEQLDNPELRGKPVIVGGRPEDRRSVVSTASYEARKFGVHSAMPVFQAYKLCPQGIFVHGRMHRYAELSHQIMNIFRDYSPDVDQMSIDEAFIDLTGTDKLFGPPEETAMAIKKRVKEETGLTVSVGLASTKYLAKIASGLSKPDGFYHIKAGNEENFMLNLPLGKVWGLGPKSLELIRSKGFTSTRDIYEKDYDTLEFLFGKNMAVFLYNVVRGIEKESFTRESKSHSISAETTFPYDLTDIYAIETELLELAQGVFFRLLKEESFSRTAMVKIRYEDFSTCTIQETVERNIITLDTFFEIIKRLFEKRYENGRGIRLLGVGFENITKEEKPYQQDLFSTNNDEKKQAVEKAILSLSKKHPEIKVSKARTLKTVLLALMISGLLPFGKAYSQTEPEELSLEAPPSLFDFDINDKNHVELTLDGFWEGRYEQSFDFSFGNNTRPSFSFSPPVFKQDVELNTLIMLNNHWYFEADFADDFKKNTVAAGYTGDGLVRSARLSNRGITMPDDYSSEFFGLGLSGGENQAPGFSMHLASPEDLFQADFLLRYDMTSVKSAVFYGMNQVTDKKLELSDFIAGREFRFPDTAESYLGLITNVYYETIGGQYKDRQGKSYRKLSADEYVYLPSKNILLISVNAEASVGQDNKKPSILLTFANNSTVDAILYKAGSYDQPETFLGKIQTAFDRKKYRLEDFTARQKTQIEGMPALVIQDSTGFSPFLSAQYYDTGSASDNEISVISKTTEETVSQFDAVEVPEYYTALFEDFFNETHHYVRIVNNTEKTGDLSESLDAFPFAKVSPEVYLGLDSALYGGNDLCLLVRSYIPQNELNIGKDAAAGTVLVYKNGILLRNSSYDKNTGKIILGESISSTDKITVTWQEDDTDITSGAAVLGAGIKAQFLPCLYGDLIFTSRWPVNLKKQAAASGDGIKSGFAALTTGITYKRNDFELTEKASISLRQENTLGGLTIVNQQSPVARKYTFEQSDAENMEKDPELGSWCARLDLPQSGRSYTDIKLTNGSMIANSDTLLLTLKPDFTWTCLQKDFESAFDIYLLLGIEKGQNLEDDELELYPHWKLNGASALDITKKSWQTISLTISDGQRSRLTGASDARLLIVRRDGRGGGAAVASGGATGNGISGGILFGAYEPVPRAVFTQASGEIFAASRIVEYETEKFASCISWKNPPSSKEGSVKTSSYFTPSDFSSYKTISWDFLTTGKATPLTLILDDGSDGQNALLLELKNEAVENLSQTDNYHHLTISLDSGEVFIDGNKQSSEKYNLTLNSQIVPCRQQLVLYIPETSSQAVSGEVYNGVLTFENSKLYATFQNYTAAQYSKKGNLIMAGSFPLLKDTELQASSLQDTGSLSNPKLAVKSDAKAKATIAGLTGQTELSFQQESLTQAGHNLKTDNQIIPVIYAEDNYHLDIHASEIKKNNSFALDFSKLKVPVNLSLKTQAQDNSKTGRQKAELSLKWTQPVNIYTIGLNSKYEGGQKTPRPFSINGPLNANDYFEKWSALSQAEFSEGKSTATNRDENFSSEIFSDIPFKTFSIKPKISYSLGGQYSNAKDIYFQDKENAALLLPFSFDGKELSFELTRNGGGTLPLINTDNLVTNGSYKSDTKKILSLQEDRGWFYTSIPFYEIFDSSLKNKITGDYSAKYEIKFSRRLSNSFADLYIPSSAGFALSRDIKYKVPENADLWQLKLVLTNTSINNFGKNSSSKLFTWFLQEEILSRFTGLVKIPYGSYSENLRYQFNEYLQILFYIKDKSTFTSTFDVTLANEPAYDLIGIFAYERPSQTSLMTAAAYLLFPASKSIAFTITRKDSLSIELSKKSEEMSQKYSYNHSADVKFLEHYSVKGGFGITFTNVTDHAQRLSFSLSLGAKAEF